MIIVSVRKAILNKFSLSLSLLVCPHKVIRFYPVFNTTYIGSFTAQKADKHWSGGRYSAFTIIESASSTFYFAGWLSSWEIRWLKTPAWLAGSLSPRSRMVLPSQSVPSRWLYFRYNVLVTTYCHNNCYHFVQDIVLFCHDQLINDCSRKQASNDITSASGQSNQTWPILIFGPCWIGITT